MANPFTTRAIRSPGLLIGREKLLARLQNEIESGPVLLVGGRRTGKTSLVRCFETIIIERESNDTCWYWDAQDLPSGCGLKGACQDFYKPDGLEEEIKKIKKAGGRLVLIIDEFDCLSSVDNHGAAPRFCMNDYEKLRSLLGKYDKTFVIIAVSSKELPEITMRGSELFNMFIQINMKSLELNNTDEFYQKYLAQTGCIEFLQDKQKLQIFEKAGYFASLHPWLLQLAGVAAFSAAGNNEEYSELLRDKFQIVSKHVGKLLDTLHQNEALWFCICCQDVTDNSIFSNATRDESLGLITRGMIPGAIKLAALHWLETILPQDKVTMYDKYMEQSKQKFADDNIKHKDIAESVLQRSEVINNIQHPRKSIGDFDTPVMPRSETAEIICDYQKTYHMLCALLREVKSKKAQEVMLYGYPDPKTITEIARLEFEIEQCVLTMKKREPTLYNGTDHTPIH